MPILEAFSLDHSGLNGPDTGIKYAKGTAIAANSQSAFADGTSNTRYFYKVSVTGIGFRPTRITLRRNVTADNEVQVTYSALTRGAPPAGGATSYNLATVPASTHGSTVYTIKVWELTGTGDVGAYVSEDSFILPFYFAGAGVVWEAFGVE